jgi:hypothetical protein
MSIPDSEAEKIQKLIYKAIWGKIKPYREAQLKRMRKEDEQDRAALRKWEQSGILSDWEDSLQDLKNDTGYGTRESD